MISATRPEQEHAAASQRLRPPVRRIAVWGPFMVVLALAIALIYGIWRHIQLQRDQRDFAQKTSQVTVEFIEASPDSRARTLVLPGNLTAVNQTTVYARASGYIDRWLVDIGDNVRAGQVLAVIAAPDLDQQLAQAREQYNTSQANFELARVTAQRWLQLVRKLVVSKQEADEKQSAYQAAATQLAADKANFERLASLQGFTSVVAPFAGKVTARLVDVGVLASAGSGAAGTPLYTIAKTDPLDIFVAVPQTNAPVIRDGLGVNVLVPEYPKRKFPGKVIRTSGAIDPVTRTLNAEVEIPNPEGLLYAGMYTQVEFALDETGSPIVIPDVAFVFNAEGSRVATVTNDNKIHWQKIQVGRDFGTEMEAVSGLQAKTRIVMNPTDDLVEGLAVVPKPAAPRAAPDKASPGAPGAGSSQGKGPEHNHPE